MSGDSYRRVQSGQPLRIAADAWNEMLQVARDHRASNALAAGGIAGAVRDADIVLVKNEAGTDVPRFGVLGIAGVIFTAAESLSEFQARIAFRGVEPALPDHRGRFVVCLEPIADGKIGRAWVSGVCAVKVQGANVSALQYCDPIDGSFDTLQAADHGSARILHRDPTGEGIGGQIRWCVVRLGDGLHATHHLCKTPAGGMNKGTVANLDVWQNPYGATSPASSGTQLPNVINAYADLLGNKFVSVALHGNGRWYVVAAECQ
jgi:hypothetical protein